MKKTFIYFLYGILFILFFSFAIQNTASVILAWRPIFLWEAPLILIVSISFASGILFGYLITLWLRRSSRQKHLKNENKMDTHSTMVNR